MRKRTNNQWIWRLKCVISVPENGFITSESFGHWADSTFFPKL